MTLAERGKMSNQSELPAAMARAADRVNALRAENERLKAELADVKMKLNLIRHIIDRDDVARDQSLVPTG